jgi:hypothetical protein
VAYICSELNCNQENTLKMKDNKDNKDVQLELSVDDANALLQSKIAELNLSNTEVIALKNQMADLRLKTAAVHEENQLMQVSPEYAAISGEMKAQLAMARQFSASKAFPKLNPEQIYVLMKAGSEMGMKPMESLNSLYVINGKIEPYGKAMPTLLTKNGYTPSYSNETPEGCVVTVTKGDVKIVEVVNKRDLTKLTGAYSISPKNKLRFHGLRMVLNFHLPHLISGCADLFDSSVVEGKESNSIAGVDSRKQNNRVLEHIEKSKTVADLRRVGKMVDECELREEYDSKMDSLTIKIEVNETV